MVQQRLGEYLVSIGALSEQDLAYALDLQRHSQERLGTILLASSLIDRRTLYNALSLLWALRGIERRTA